MLVSELARCEMRDVALKVDLIVIRFHGVRIDRHASPGGGREPDDASAAGAAARDAAFMDFVGVVVETHIAIPVVVRRCSCMATYAGFNSIPIN